MLSYTPLLVIAYRFILKIRGKPLIASPKSQRECLDARREASVHAVRLLPTSGFLAHPLHNLKVIPMPENA